jgi:hypothetical protein
MLRKEDDAANEPEVSPPQEYAADGDRPLN